MNMQDPWAATPTDQTSTTTTEVLGLTVLCGARDFERRAGADALAGQQRQSGGWPLFRAAEQESAYSTGLAIHALLSTRWAAYNAHALRGLRYLLASPPGEVSWVNRLKFRIADTKVAFNPNVYGWSWVNRTFSWVVPTAMALIAIEHALETGLAAGREVEDRRRLGREMLIDRCCPTGGWNAGNAVVYGVPLTPHVDTTAVALLALRSVHPHPITATSLQWLRSNQTCRSAYSLAWAMLAVDSYGQENREWLDQARSRLSELVLTPDQTRDPSTAALAHIALGLSKLGNPFKVGG